MGRAAGEQVQKEVDLSDTQSPEFTLPIDVVPGTDPPRFRWRQVVDSPVGVRVIEHERVMLPSVEGAVLALVELAKEQSRQIVALRAAMTHVTARATPAAPPIPDGTADDTQTSPVRADAPVRRATRR